MRCDVTPTDVPTLDLASPTLAADVARVLDGHGLAVTTNDARKIVGITNSGYAPDGPGGPTLALYETQAPHGLWSSAVVVVSGSPHAAYNGQFTVDEVPSPTTFYSGERFYAADTLGGQWEPV